MNEVYIHQLDYLRTISDWYFVPLSQFCSVMCVNLYPIIITSNVVPVVVTISYKSTSDLWTRTITYYTIIFYLYNWATIKYLHETFTKGSIHRILKIIHGLVVIYIHLHRHIAKLKLYMNPIIMFLAKKRENIQMQVYM